MRFIDFLKNKSLNEMAMSREDARASIFTSLHSAVEHLIKISIAPDLFSAQKDNDWEKQINGFLDRISRVKLTNTNKRPQEKFYFDIIDAVISDYNDDPRIDILSKEIKEHSNYDGTPLKNPNKIKMLKNIKEYLKGICSGISKTGNNNFKENYLEILDNLREL